MTLLRLLAALLALVAIPAIASAWRSTSSNLGGATAAARLCVSSGCND
jgi:uncharacterized membrane protein YbjE (DUF340 family)